MPASLVMKKFSAFTLGLFAIVLPNVWAFAASGILIRIYASGMPILVWGSLAVGVVLSLLVTSFAEFGSAYPSVAGCVTLASELGGPRYGRICGFMTGGLHALASLITPACLIISHAPFVSTMAMVMNPSWSPTRWQSFLICQAVNLAVMLICLRGSRFLEVIAAVASVILFGLFFSSVGVIVGCADPTAPSEFVWSRIQNVSGWPNSLAFRIGASGPLSGYGPTHWVLNMAEDVDDPRRAIPIAFLMQQLGSVLTLFIFFIAIGYGVGENRSVIIDSPYPAPIHGCGTKAFPFSEWMGAYDSRLQIPQNIIYVIFAFNVVLGFVELGSSSALVTLVGAATVLFSVGYIPVFIAYLATGGRHLGTKGWFRLPRRVSLGLAAFNVASLVLQCVMLCLPPSYPITVENMNWASAVAGGFILFLVFGFWAYGSSHYDADEDLVIHGERLLQKVSEPGALDVVDIDGKK
ncbi:choline transport protein [Colletotrichum sojae]|uniref:Choline transport protein n=1 Tax=Colletotrichum sojae TaxID=2175907 RepID=A0A8H6IPE9_9PEZI|nr:choline transport protein [Colletotrichum sojae]